MRKLLIAAAVMMAVVWYMSTFGRHGFGTYADVLANCINSAQPRVFKDTNFNTEIKVPSIFVLEEDTTDIAYSYARFACYPPTHYIDAEGQLTIEYSATVCRDGNEWTTRIDSVTRDDGYINYSKSIRRQKMKFTYSLTYPSAYENSVSKLKTQVREWKAFSKESPKKQLIIGSRRQKKGRPAHSGFITE